jgi:hypothetical protein
MVQNKVMGFVIHPAKDFISIPQNYGTLAPGQYGREKPCNFNIGAMAVTVRYRYRIIHDKFRSFIALNAFIEKFPEVCKVGKWLSHRAISRI